MLLLNTTPSPDTAYIVGRSAAQGRIAGLVSVAGISTGCCVHAIALAVGLSALLATLVFAFTLIEVAGGIYLIYLGVKMLLSSASKNTSSELIQTKKIAADYLLASTGDQFIESESNFIFSLIFSAIRGIRRAAQNNRFFTTRRSVCNHVNLLELRHGASWRRVSTTTKKWPPHSTLAGARRGKHFHCTWSAVSASENLRWQLSN